ncbi:MAG: hypothetical protein PHQ47_01210 [Candidatus Portnoybacteria bacterium]|nr:hypothetical protein [Candidatus Portnoybacteria bacterium]
MSNPSLQRLPYQLAAILIGLSIGLALQFAEAWTNPASSPPAANSVGAPVTASAGSQLKAGALGVSGLLRAYGTMQVAILKLEGLNNCDLGTSATGTLICIPSFSWYTSDWSSCSPSCGPGTQTRTVYCQRNDGANMGTICGIYPGCECPMPETSQSCEGAACCADECSSAACSSGITFTCRNCDADPCLDKCDLEGPAFNNPQKCGKWLWGYYDGGYNFAQENCKKWCQEKGCSGGSETGKNAYNDATWAGDYYKYTWWDGSIWHCDRNDSAKYVVTQCTCN